VHKKVLQIFLVGQPELEENLWNKNLRQMRERVSLKYRLKKLDRDETVHYIQHRLTVAGRTNGRTIFTAPAMKSVYELSDGIPRRINILCENALLMGYAENFKHIDEDTVKKVGYYNQNDESIPEFIENEFTPQPLRIDTAAPPKPMPTATKQQTTPSPAREASIKQVEKRLEELRQKSKNNGAFDYKKFQSYMHQYLETNQLSITQKSNTASTILKITFAFLLLVISFLTAIYVAMQMGIIK
jgi:hypothetical protein